MAISIKTPNLRVLMIQSLKDIFKDEEIKISTAFDSRDSRNQIRVNYMGSDRVQTMFLSADYSIDVFSKSFSEAERISYKICDNIQDYKKNSIVDAEIIQFPIDYTEDGIAGELRSISIEALIRPENR